MGVSNSKEYNPDSLISISEEIHDSPITGFLKSLSFSFDAIHFFKEYSSDPIILIDINESDICQEYSGKL